MSDVNSNSKHVKNPKNDGNDDEKQKPFHNKLPARPLHQRTIVLLLVVFFILLIGSYMLLRPPVSQSVNKSAQTIDQEAVNTNSVGTYDSGYQTIAGSPISTKTTENFVKTKPKQERIEIPADVIDKMASDSGGKTVQNSDNNLSFKITQLGKNNHTAPHTKSAKVFSSVRTKKIDSAKRELKYKELTLFPTIENEHYTIQLNGATMKKNLEIYAKQNQLSNFQIYQTKRQNAPWYVILKGNYPTIKDAKSALSALPEKLKEVNPWIRSGKSFQLLRQ